MEDKIIRFIESFTAFGEQVTELFTKRHCYGFALILLNNFKEGSIWWDKYNRHAIFKYNDDFYDITGLTYPSNDIYEIPVRIDEDVYKLHYNY